MRVSLKLLKDYIDIDEKPEIIAEKLSMLGIVVEKIEYLGQNIENVVTGIVTNIKKHPKYINLYISKVSIGKEIFTVVVGADNIKKHDIVAIALVGAILPNGVKIKKMKFKGITSYGMLCSADDLQLNKMILHASLRKGVYIFPYETIVGVDIKQILNLDDIIFEINLTPNRVDCNNIIGIAREVAIAFDKVINKPILHVRENAKINVFEMVNVKVTEPALCPRYIIRVLTDVRVSQSPTWLIQKLQLAGICSVNNIVDVINFVMLEMGQPLHVYDYNLISQHILTVRKAQNGEYLTTIDGKKRALNSDMLVIADATQVINIAGVIGGLATEISSTTRNIILEAGAFDSASITRTANSLGLHSETSIRFERGVDTMSIISAIDRAAKLLENMNACKVCSGIIDIYSIIKLPTEIIFNPEQINKYLGINITQQQMVEILKRLEFNIKVNYEKITARIPTWRSDISTIQDISEEIARVYGYEKIPVKIPSIIMMNRTKKYETFCVDFIKQIMSAVCFDEIITLSFTSLEILDKLNISSDSYLRKAIQLLNPITDKLSFLRTTLIGGIINNVLHNLSYQNENFKIYELGSVFIPVTFPIDSPPEERVMICGAMVGRRYDITWNQPYDIVDFYDAKGVVENILDKFGIKNYRVFAGDNQQILHPGRTAMFYIHDDCLGIVGEVHPKVLESFGINRKVYLFEMPLEKIISYSQFNSKFKQIPKFPKIIRDLAIILPIKINVEQVVKVMKFIGGSLLVDINLFDVYDGSQINCGDRSLGFTMTFQGEDRTLTYNEVEEVYQNIVITLKKTFFAKIREK